MRYQSGLKRDPYHCISSQKNSMRQFGTKEQFEGDKYSMKESQDIS